MRETRQLLLVRHGLTDWNREGRFQGHLDPPLSDDGREEARLLAGRIARSTERPQRIISSTLGRALETARLIAAALDDATPVEPDVRLIEIGQGEWEGRTHAELEVHDPERYAAWRDRTVEPPGSEPIEEALARVADLLAETEASDASPLCLVSHGGTLRLLAGHLLQLTEKRFWGFDLDNASLSTLSWTSLDGWRLESWNDAHHVLGRGPVHVAESDGAPLAL